MVPCAVSQARQSCQCMGVNLEPLLNKPLWIANDLVPPEQLFLATQEPPLPWLLCWLVIENPANTWEEELTGPYRVEKNVNHLFICLIPNGSVLRLCFCGLLLWLCLQLASLFISPHLFYLVCFASKRNCFRLFDHEISMGCVSGLAPSLM